jgi:tetratricopeptide (TPR) repeat protein
VAEFLLRGSGAGESSSISGIRGRFGQESRTALARALFPFEGFSSVLRLFRLQPKELGKMFQEPRLLSGNPGMTISLGKASRRLLFYSIVILISGGLSSLAARAWLAAQWNESPNPSLWMRAARLEPGNATYWHHLGTYERWNFVQGDLNKAASYFRRATELNPGSDGDWMELASAYESLGDAALAERAYQNAKWSHPVSSEVAWRYGSFLIRQGDYGEALREIRRALITDPSLTTSAVSQCWRAGLGVPAIVEQVLPPQTGYYLTALTYFLSQHQTEAALVVWSRLLKLGQPLQMGQTLPLIDELIDENRIPQAVQTWQEALRIASWPQESGDGTSLVFDGGFEQAAVNGGFGWREQSSVGTSYAFDEGVVHSERRSLRITFDGSANLDFQQLFEYVPVEPQQPYRFSAYLRTEQLSTDSGIRFAIYDLRDPAALKILTPDLVGTNPWMLVQADVATTPNTRVLALVLRRIPTWKFDNKLRGTVWVDDVALVPVGKGTKSRL